MGNVSRKQKGLRTLKRIQDAAKTSIGLCLDEEQIQAAHMARDAWIAMVRLLLMQNDCVLTQIITKAKQKPYFHILTSIKGISDISVVDIMLKSI